MTELLFQLSFGLAAPFWALMIVAPRWAWTIRIISSPLIVVPSLAVCLALYAQVMPDLLMLVSSPSLEKLTSLAATPAGLAGLWAQIIAWDLLIGRWIYLDGRERQLPTLLMSPLLLATLFLSPFVMPIYLLTRTRFPSRSVVGRPV